MSAGAVDAAGTDEEGVDIAGCGCFEDQLIARPVGERFGRDAADVVNISIVPVVLFRDVIAGGAIIDEIARTAQMNENRLLGCFPGADAAQYGFR